MPVAVVCTRSDWVHSCALTRFIFVDDLPVYTPYYLTNLQSGPVDALVLDRGER